MPLIALLLTFFISATTQAQPLCLTCDLRTQKGDDFGDPSAPDFSVPGEVQVLTTNGEILTWKSKGTQTGVERFFSGQRPTRSKLKTFDADGKTYLEPWDPSIQVFPEFGDKKILYAGVTTAPPGRKKPRWPDDEWRRRVQAFEFDSNLNKWIRIADSVFGDPAEEISWLGHGYGHHVIRDENGTPWMFYEKVTADNHGMPWVTEMYARQMLSPTELSAIEIPILEFSKNNIWPAARRYSGGALLEGPRPFKVEDYYFVAFSAGEYQSDTYGIHLACSSQISGPFEPFLNEQRDLNDFGAEIETSFPMTWGAARAVFFEFDGRLFTLFHGIPTDDQERLDHEERDVFLTSVQVHTRPGDCPLLTLDQFIGSDR